MNMNMKNAAVDSPHLSGLPETHLGLGGYFFFFFFFLTCFFHTTIHACSLLNSAICFCISSSFSKVIDFSGMILGLHRICSKDEKGVSKQLSLPLSLSLSLSLCSALCSLCGFLCFGSTMLLTQRHDFELTSLGLCFSEKTRPDLGNTSWSSDSAPFDYAEAKEQARESEGGDAGKKKRKRERGTLRRSVFQASKGKIILFFSTQTYLSTFAHLCSGFFSFLPSPFRLSLKQRKSGNVGYLAALALPLSRYISPANQRFSFPSFLFFVPISLLLAMQLYYTTLSVKKQPRCASWRQ